MTVTVIQVFKDSMPVTSMDVKLSFYDPFLIQMTCDHKMDGAIMNFANNAVATSFVDAAAAQEYIDYCSNTAVVEKWIPPLDSQTIVPYIQSDEWVPIELNPYFPHHEVPDNWSVPANWPL
jgi:hypothetical protein